ncbi:peptidase, partial [Streptomyces cavourensis]
MFERFTRGARATVKGAVAQAERAGAASVTEEHLLLALLEQDGSRASFALASLGLPRRRASLEAAFTEARRRGG